MYRNKLTSKCIGENTKNIFEKQNNPPLFNPPARPSTSFIGFSTFNLKATVLI